MDTVHGEQQPPGARGARDLAALLALPAMWVDREPPEIGTGLLSVLVGLLRLHAAYVRFDDPDGGPAFEGWLPTGPLPPAELRVRDQATPPAATTSARPTPTRARIAAVPLALPREAGLLVVSAQRGDFPTAGELQVLRIAASLAAVAVHTARRLARERAGRRIAEEALRRQTELLRSLADRAPSLEATAQRIREVAESPAAPPPGGRLAGPPDGDGARARDSAARPHAMQVRRAPDTVRAGPSAALTHREQEVLGLLAQGLSNKEIGGVLWLSDRTVERHITGLYRKIGVARRSEATAFALRNGVV